MGKLEGKVALVTGAGRGVGRAIVRKLASEGARIVANDLDAQPLNEVVEALRAAGSDAHPVAGDVAEPSFGDRFVSAALERMGTIDILVNNAGYIWNTTVQNHSDEQWYAMLDVHATGPFRILRAFARFLRPRAKQEQAAGAVPCRKVVNVSSVSGVYGAATQLAYSAAKAAVAGMTKTLAKEWGRYNVTVNCVAFGDIDTRLTEPFDGAPHSVEIRGRSLKVGLERSALERMTQLTPLGRRGRPEDAAGAVSLFCLPESDFITGQVVVCSGGLVL